MIDRNFVLNLAHKDGDINEYLMTLYNIPVQMEAKCIVEIGAGVSSFALAAAANKIGGTVLSIDVGGTDTLNRVSDGAKTMSSEENFLLLPESSLSAFCPFSWIDFIFWDSEHTLDLSRKEIPIWFPKVRRGGVIACHDTGHEDPDKQGAKVALDEYLEEHPGEYIRLDLMDTKLIGMTLLVKL